jgi:hypothetical protein
MKIDRNQLLSELEEMTHIGLSFQEVIGSFFKKYDGKDTELERLTEGDEELKSQYDKLQEVFTYLEMN